MDIKLANNLFYKIEQKSKVEELYFNFNTSEQNLLRNNPDLELYEGEWVKIKQNEYLTHVVKPTENLNKIAEKYNINKQKLMQDNNLKSEHLFIGQIIKIYKK